MNTQQPPALTRCRCGSLYCGPARCRFENEQKIETPLAKHINVLEVLALTGAGRDAKAYLECTNAIAYLRKLDDLLERMRKAADEAVPV